MDSFWKGAVNCQIDSMLSNRTLELDDLPHENKLLGSKWTDKRKRKLMELMTNTKQELFS